MSVRVGTNDVPTLPCCVLARENSARVGTFFLPTRFVLCNFHAWVQKTCPPYIPSKSFNSRSTIAMTPTIFQSS